MVKPGDIFLGILKHFYQAVEYPRGVNPELYSSYMMIIAKVQGENIWYDSYMLDKDQNRIPLSTMKHCNIFHLIDAVEDRTLRVLF